MADENKPEKTAEVLQAVGKGSFGCGCLMTIFITIPIILLLLFL